MDLDRTAFDRTLARVRRRLLDSRNEKGHWTGELSSSALSTATAVCALGMADREGHAGRIESGLSWLAATGNEDGGYGDTTISRSNISTTALCWAAFRFADRSGRFAAPAEKAAAWLEKEAGSLDGPSLAAAVAACYGRDSTFAVPILTLCNLTGCLGRAEESWRLIKPLPFELAVLPRSMMKGLRLSVVSYALPALIAIGQARFHFAPPANPVIRLIRTWTRAKTLDTLERIQPSSGGFLEAVPLTSFVVLSLAAAGGREHPVVEKGIDFLTRSMRPDGSWPIDTNLATWVTTLSINALSGSRDFDLLLDRPERRKTEEWLLAQQQRTIHPYTGAAPGGWAWTDLPGGVPDADDTSGALLALINLGGERDRLGEAVAAGIGWLTGLQNRDGGFPTFCKGWGRLPFDSSAPDLTAHAVAALSACSSPPIVNDSLRIKAQRSLSRGLAYLGKVQERGGAWIPLWFGSESAPSAQNPVYGTARVLASLAGLPPALNSELASMRERGVSWLLGAQNGDGGWGGAPGCLSTIEETALSLHALAGASSGMTPELVRGVGRLIELTDEGREMPPAAIGLYFARLWYHEALYPLVFSLQALEKLERLIR